MNLTDSKKVDPFLNPELRTFTIDFNEELGFIDIKGWSLPTDVDDQYSRLQIQVKDYLKDHQQLTMNLKYEMLNSTTIKYLLDLIKQMNRAHMEGKYMKIFWNCDPLEQEMIEAAMDVSLMCKFDLEIISNHIKIKTQSLENDMLLEKRKLIFRTSRVKFVA